MRCFYHCSSMRCFYSVTAANTGGDVISRAFLHALVALIGGYREALTFLPNQKIQFDEAAFLASRPAHMKHFLESLLHLQVIYVLEQPRIVLQVLGHSLVCSYHSHSLIRFFRNVCFFRARDMNAWISCSVRECFLILHVFYCSSPSLRTH